MKSLLKTSITLFVLLYVTTIYAQDRFFTHYERAPLELNPSLAGLFDGKHRALINYRNQWPSLLGENSYQSTSIGYDTKVNISESHHFGIGANVLLNVAGSAKKRDDKYGVSIAYNWHLNMEKVENIFSLGTNIAMLRNSIGNNLKWPSQGDGQGGFDPDLPGGQIDNDIVYNADLSIGLNWRIAVGEKLSFNSGIAVNHLNMPNVGFSDNTIGELNKRLVVYTYGEIAIAKRIDLMPSLLYFNQNVFQRISPGLGLKYNINNNSIINSVQISYRNSVVIDAHSINTMTNENRLQTQTINTVVELKNFSIGINYDNGPKILGIDTDSSSYEFSIGYILD